MNIKKIAKVVGITVGAVAAVVVILLVVLLIRNRIEATKPRLEDDYYKAFTSSSALELRYAQRGAQEVAVTDFERDSPVKTISVWYPRALEDSSERYPMVMVVNGSNTTASVYRPYFERLASWGFVVVGTEDGGAGSGLSTSQTLDFMLDLPQDSVLHDRIDPDNIGLTGYSQGGAGALRAVTAFDNSDVYKTLFTGSAAYSALAMTQGWGYDAGDVDIPYFMSAGTGSSDDTGVQDTTMQFGGVAPLSSLVENYEAMPDGVSKVRARVVGAEHEEVQQRTDGYMTAWMLYQLQGDQDAAAVFVGENAEILQNSNWQDVEKNL